MVVRVHVRANKEEGKEGGKDSANFCLDVVLAACFLTIVIMVVSRMCAGYDSGDESVCRECGLPAKVRTRARQLCLSGRQSGQNCSARWHLLHHRHDGQAFQPPAVSPGVSPTRVACARACASLVQGRVRVRFRFDFWAGDMTACDLKHLG
jgi:hypothetical protein